MKSDIAFKVGLMILNVIDDVSWRKLKKIVPVINEEYRKCINGEDFKIKFGIGDEYELRG